MFTVPPCSGYPQALSGKLTQLTNVADMQKNVLFFGTDADAPWANDAARRRYHLTFPFYPFRTLNPHELARSRHVTKEQPEGESNSPMIPAHAQLNFCFKRKTGPNLLDQMLIEQLPTRIGAVRQDLTGDERRLALTYGGDGAAGNPQYTVTAVRVLLNNCFLQVSPPPLSIFFGGGRGGGDRLFFRDGREIYAGTVIMKSV